MHRRHAGAGRPHFRDLPAAARGRVSAPDPGGHPGRHPLEQCPRLLSKATITMNQNSKKNALDIETHEERTTRLHPEKK